MSFRRSTPVALLGVAGLLMVSAVFASSAMATPPTAVYVNSSGSATVAAGDLCSFPVEIDGTQTYSQTTFYDQNGVITERNTQGTEQDTFNANGKTLVGAPYPFNFFRDYADGLLISYHGTAIAERVPLPGGNYIVAGRIDLIHTAPAPILTVDSGNSGNNLNAFCAALS